MTNILAFIITLGQLVLIVAAYYVPWPDVLTLMISSFSPVFIFLELLNTALEFSGEFSMWLGVGLVYCVVKYFIISRAIMDDGVGFLDVSAMLMEVIYLAGSTFYVVKYSFS